jgi:PAS domain S-box-containing protein
MTVFGRRTLDHVGYAAAAIAIVLMASLAYRASALAWRSTELVQHAAQELDDVSGVAESFNRAKAAQRGFLLTSDRHFIESRDAAFGDTRLRLARLKARNVDNPAKFARVATVQRELDARRALMIEDERARHAGLSPGGGSAAAEQRYEVGVVSNILRELRQREVAAVEAQALNERRTLMWAAWTDALAVAICVGLTTGAYLVAIRKTRARATAERRLAEITDSLPGAIFQVRTQPDGASRYEFLSCGVERVRGVSREAALRDPDVILETIIESDREGFDEALAVAKNSETALEHDLRIKRHDGEIRWIRASAAPSVQPDGSVLWTGLWVDVTERLMTRRALLESKEAAEAASQAKTTFVTTMSHEIRTPMAGVLGMLELIARTELNADQRAMFQIVQDSANSLLRIVDGILDFSKIEAGKLDLAPTPTSVASVVESVFRVYSGIAANKGLCLSRSVDARISPSLMVDELRLRQVLGNLLNNAVKFTAAGRVEIRADLIDRDDRGDVVRFCVTDTGIGIPVDAQQRLFRPYSQVFSQGAHQYGGTGLGLAICQRLAGLMGGALGVMSAPQRGTTMMFTVPLASSTEPPSAERESEGAEIVPCGPSPSGEGVLVLLVDDHPVNLMILTRQVKLLGYATESAANGLDALDLWRAGRFAIVITDCDMPQMNGYDLARNIRAAESAGGLRRTPIIACTAYAILGEAQHCIDAGMDEYLSKPVDLKRLGNALGKWLPVALRHKAPVSPSGAASDVPIDAAALGETSGGDRATECELLRRFGSCNDGDAIVLRQALAQSNLPEARRIAHRMRGASRMVGANALARACEGVERAAQSDDEKEAAAAIEGIEREMDRLREYLKTLEKA